MSEISLENEKFINDLVAAGQFGSREAVLDEAVEVLRGQLHSHGDVRSEELNAEQWCDRFEKWADGHKRIAQEADDSRESIYADRDE